ncbi:hypothetical protein [Paenibacillus sp. SN-8-1]|uniref:hypothetical protein n=1 Tax=Paenibacillus sp. SN-8-1 TaxID=3435409 RepID=UPI003D9A70BC
MGAMTKEEVMQRSKEIVDFLSDKNQQAIEAGLEQHAQFLTSVAFTMGSLVGFDLKPAGYGPALRMLLEAITDGLQHAATEKGVNATFVKVVRD